MDTLAPRPARAKWHALDGVELADLAIAIARWLPDLGWLWRRRRAAPSTPESRLATVRSWIGRG